MGDLFGKYRREQAALEQQKLLEEEERKAKAEAEAAQGAPKTEDGAVPQNEGPAEGQPAAASQDATKKTRKSRKSSKKEEEPDLAGIYYFSIPNPVASLDDKGITQVRACGHYCYALSHESNELYSWGMGDNYVLGTRDDENEHEPKLVHPQ